MSSTHLTNLRLYLIEHQDDFDMDCIRNCIAGTLVFQILKVEPDDPTLYSHTKYADPPIPYLDWIKVKDLARRTLKLDADETEILFNPECYADEEGIDFPHNSELTAIQAVHIVNRLIGNETVYIEDWLEEPDSDDPYIQMALAIAET